MNRDFMELCIVCFMMIVIMGALWLHDDKFGVSVQVVSTPSIPSHIKSFCQAQHEVYGDTFEHCIESYRSHR